MPKAKKEIVRVCGKMARSSNQAFYWFLSLPGVLYDEVLAKVHGDRIVAERLLLRKQKGFAEF